MLRGYDAGPTHLTGFPNKVKEGAVEAGCDMFVETFERCTALLPAPTMVNPNEDTEL